MADEELIKYEEKIAKQREKQRELFDYGSITKEQKDAVGEVINILEKEGQDKLAKVLTHKFQIIEHTKVPESASIFVNLAREFGLESRHQGWVVGETDENGKETHYPIMDLQDDIRVLDKFVLFIKDKYAKS